jgi:hypothetical protein
LCSGERKVNWGKYTQAGIEDIYLEVIQTEGGEDLLHKELISALVVQYRKVGIV